MAKDQAVPAEGEAEIRDLLASLDDVSRQADANHLIAIMSRATGEKPRLWGSIIGFGRYHYRYDSGREGDSFLVGFAPGRDRFSIHLMGLYLPEEEQQRESLLARLGKHKAGKACLYVRRLTDIDRDVLEQLVAVSAAALRERYPQT